MEGPLAEVFPMYEYKVYFYNKCELEVKRHDKAEKEMSYIPRYLGLLDYWIVGLLVGEKQRAVST